MAQILLVEDDSKMLAGLKDNLEIDGYEVDTATDGEAGLKKITGNKYNLVLLDGMLPKLSGFDVLKKSREQGVTTPVIMLTAKSEEIDKVLGLELGADDYITKPFSLRELLARVKAVLRRNESSNSHQEIKKVTIGKLEIDFSTYNATRNNKPVDMTPKEFEILKYLWQNKNQTVSREQLLTNVWGYDESISTRTADNFILKLRQKIEEKPETHKIILTIHGIGYKLVV
jgi:DNA-binding response OmpR family regulator